VRRAGQLMERDIGSSPARNDALDEQG